MIIAAVCVVAMLLGGWLGWRKGTKDLFSRSFDPMQQALGSSSSISTRDEFAKRRRNRLVRTVLYALAGPVVALVGLMVLVRLR